MERKDIVPLWEKQQYSLVGNHSAVKLCSWMKRGLKSDGVCYKESFYGVKCHRCLQCTPSLGFCNHRCQFCWRSIEFTEGMDMFNAKLDDPKKLLDGMIEAQRKLIIGFKGNSKVTPEKYEEARNPTNIAISLSGEPALYPYLGDLIKEAKNRGMDVFVVTNGTCPDALLNLKELPTQLYVTIPAPDFETYKKVCQPRSDKAEELWNNILRTLDILERLDCRKVVRLTLVKNLNMFNPEGYASLLKNKSIHFIEPKGYVAVGFSRKRLGVEFMPSHEEIIEFSKKICGILDMKIIDERTESKVCLLSKKDYEWRTNLKAEHSKAEKL